MEEETQVNCSNCNKPQVASKVQLHEAYCFRNIKKCPDCEEFVDKRELESHKQEKHTKQQCKYCSQPFLPKELESHIRHCIMKPERCAYCNLDVDGADYGDHLKSCGSRTRECLLCGKSIILFNYEEHMNTCVGAEEQPYESQFPTHSQAFTSKNYPKTYPLKQETKPYQPHVTKVSQTRVQIGGTSSLAQKQSDQDKADEEFARKLQQAQENNDLGEIKRLQEEEDERLAREMNKDFSPKNKTVQEVLKNQNKPKQNFDDFDYDYDDDHGYNDYQEEMEQEENQQAKQYQQGLNVPLVFPQYQKPATEKTKEQKEMEELGEFIDDDPELQQAILQSQMQK